MVDDTRQIIITNDITEEDRQKISNLYRNYLMSHPELIAEIGWACGLFHSDLTYSQFKDFCDEDIKGDYSRIIRMLDEYGPGEFLPENDDTLTFRFSENREILGYLNVRVCPEYVDKDMTDETVIDYFLQINEWQNTIIRNKEVSPIQKSIFLSWIYPVAFPNDQNIVKGQTVQSIGLMSIDDEEVIESSLEKIPQIEAYSFFLGAPIKKEEDSYPDNDMKTRLSRILDQLDLLLPGFFETLGLKMDLMTLY